MGVAYMVIARDGKEYGPVDRDTIQQWYYQGFLGTETWVYEPGGRRARPSQTFELDIWNQADLGNSTADTAAAAEKPFFQSADTDAAPARERTTGRLAAAILLIVNAAMSLLLVLAVTLAGTKDPVSTFIVRAFVDIFIAIGLLRGHQRFRGLALGRALIGAVFLGILIPIANGTVPSIVEGVLQIFFALGLVILLYGDRMSPIRIGAG